MRVLLTGSGGFVGRHLLAAMRERGWEVANVELQWGNDALDFFRYDTDPHYDLAIHSAAVVGGRASIDGSPLGVATNMALDSWYFQWLIRTGTPRAVYFSSSAAYPVELQQPGDIHRLVEDDIDLNNPGLPDASYGLAKVTGERLAAYAEAEGCRVHVLRPMSGYGADQDDCYPFPAFIGRAKRREDPFEVWGDGSSTRDWIHVDDVVGATLAAIDHDVTGPVNLGWGRATSFDQLASYVTQAAGYTPRIKHLPTAPQGVHHRVCDPTRMLSFYQPAVTLEEGIRRALNS
ncbi:NAD(P)-dependent oxidoreductase [Streptomyces sp. C3-3]|uniref:NAD-dependent epimerase/dehydratase family protein n=1 Tax=Streptomyces sp. C3-3 TaxID=2824901 RepID=UPI001B3820C1|nr:NAD-dependent epimerase/dehydratase family protein [Streptomyces sp. C3-3]MBQ1118332.1 NAD-dependent epimerase/dehydratase family protein [Streptomyces sp. C3-3]